MPKAGFLQKKKKKYNTQYFFSRKIVLDERGVF